MKQKIIRIGIKTNFAYVVGLILCDQSLERLN
jgi:hypothetical protein